MKKIFILIFLLLICVVIFLFTYKAYLFGPSHTLVTYFSYTETELKPLKSLSTNQTMNINRISKWDAIMFDLVKDNKLGDVYAARIYAYVYVAQRDAAFISKNIKGSSMGALDIVSAKVLCQFFPSDCNQIMKQTHFDFYSNTLADIVLSKIIARIKIENQNIKPYAEKVGENYWAGTKPYFGQDVGSWKTWFLSSGSEFRAPSPEENHIDWNEQLNMSHKALLDITPEQRKAVVFWAGNPGTITPPGQWLEIANEYMQENNITLLQQLFIRSVLAMGIEDSVIAVFDSKYTYWVKRPNMKDSNIVTVMPTPNHPSYPAGHSTISGSASVILTYFFPQNATKWDHDANEASLSRVWGGIHFPADADAGVILGKKVGEKAIQYQPTWNTK